MDPTSLGGISSDSMSTGALFASFMIGTIGFSFFIYGKKQSRLPHAITGIALMMYPYFITNLAGMLGVGALIVAADWYAVRQGY